MAIYHLSTKSIGRSAGHSAVAAAAYRSGESLVNERDGVEHDYSRRQQAVSHSEMMLPEGAPSWMNDRETLWNHVESIEKRKDSRLAREIDIALPRELSLDKQKDLIRGFVQSEFVDKGLVADVAIHDAEGNNPHAHVLLTTRVIDPSQESYFEKKSKASVSRTFNRTEALKEWRVSWQEHANKALEAANSNERIDHRTLAAQGLLREPQQHLGKHATWLERKGERSRRGDANLIVKQMNVVSRPAPRNPLEMQRALDDVGRRYYQVMYGHEAAYGDVYDMGRDFYGHESHEREGYER